MHTNHSFKNHRNFPLTHMSLDDEIIPLELSSAYRDRSVWPNPFRFDSILNNTGQKTNGISAFDPITYQLPVNLGTIPSLSPNPILLEWQGLDVNVSGTISSINFDEVEITFTTPFDTTHNYYRGLLCQFVGNTFGHINEYVFLGPNIGLFRFDSLPSTLPAVGSVVNIVYNGLLSSSVSSVFSVFIPKTMDQSALAGFYIYNETLNEGKKISTYSSSRSEALVPGGPVPTWTNSHIYSVRRELPYISTVSASTTSSVTLTPVPVGTGSPGDFIRNRTTGEIVTILTIDKITGVVTFTPSVVAWAIGSIVEILIFARDSYNFITYASLQREAPTAEYEASLVSLSLPRERLVMDFAVEKIPFVYLEIRDSDNPNTNSFMSNIAGSRRALFKATAKSNRTDNRPFVKFSGDRAIKTFKFRPSASNFTFSILNQEGNPLTLWVNDTLSPYPPNRLLQCEVLLNIRKINNDKFA
ncbi:hypothetical protein IIV31_045R [Armadillidium vulgare iridescent virus]|uniref:Uncharacterized protein n=1 Tax=Armadillidium vulgare iridescent virus TaxID=72201 RepID=A0A068QK64_9VIRU|nr:hypothetical protein IIV31_045R [Armadillidium vulgare iridescent virus]CCV02417.1 hypothetical protein IIV31_045R [Armadillidium vulgare iridescent virus]